MNRRTLVAAVLALAVPVAASAATKKATTGKPADATAQCSDGTYSKAKTKQGACSSHGGVKTWYADEGTAAAPAAPASPATTATKSVRAPKPARSSNTATPEPPATTAAAPSPTPASTTTTKPTTTAPATGDAKDATAKCKDGTFSHAKQHSGACSHHGGVAEWYK